MDILEEIVANKRREMDLFLQTNSLEQLYRLTEPLLAEPVPSMREELMQSGTGIIAEFKRKSPSKGWIHEDAKAEEVPLSYQRNGAAAVSILTDNRYFGGRDAYISTARRAGVTLPILYKNFIVHELQLCQARLCGASAVLLIAAVLPLETCRELTRKAHELGLEVLLEMHGEHELDYVETAPDIFGINNRDLGTFHTDVENSFRLARRLPAAACKVSESGIGNVQTVCRLREVGFRGFLMGEHFMRSAMPGEALGDFINALSAVPRDES